MKKNRGSLQENLDIDTNSEKVETDEDGITSGSGWREYIRERGRKIGALGAGVLALTGVGAYLAEHTPDVKALGSTPASLAAVDSSSVESASKCAEYDPNTVSVDYVDNAVLPLAGEVINVYHHARRSQKKKLKAPELYGDSYKHLTEVDVAIPAHWAGSKRKGTYNVTAQFTGHVTANKMVAVEVQEYPGHLKPHGHQKQLSPYDYILEKTTHDGASNALGLHWVQLYDYLPPAKCGVVDSLLANGNEISTPSLTESFFDATNQQAMGVIKRMEQHKPLAHQVNLAAS